MMSTDQFHRVQLTAVLIVVTLVLSACTVEKQDKVMAAATAPLNDLNLVKVEIPAVLLAAQKTPYAVPTDQTCSALDQNIVALDEVLGADLDTPAFDTHPGLLKRGLNAVESAAVGTLRQSTTGIVPFRGWVRKLSGAARHSKKVEAAISAGIVRRAFIKGLRVSQNCAADKQI